MTQVNRNKPLWLQPSVLFIFLTLIPILGALLVWLSPLAFVPVPWPDDSAFYFVARELFRWPPRWVMLPQAPFEPTYRVFNFNTMPLYPVLIGLGRFIGIDGTFLLKIWPLSAWALSGTLLVTVLYKKGLPFFECILLVLAFALDPELRWGSTLIRPESLIGLFGIALVLGIVFQFPARFQPTRFWDPVAALLALAAYSHFNSIHLVLPVLFAFMNQPRRLIEIGWKTTLYLSPWLLAVLYYWHIFVQQMATQWNRLNVPNPWLESWTHAVASLFQELGSPMPWPSVIYVASGIMGIFILAAGIWGLAWPVFQKVILQKPARPDFNGTSIHLLPATVWLVSALWLWNSKPEVWFMYYTHVALWCFCGLAALKIHLAGKRYSPWILNISKPAFAVMITIFGYTNLSQAVSMYNTNSWHWSTYYDFVDCIDHQLTQLEKDLDNPHPFQVWDPTFPDVTVELSRRHPDWELTRTNDFMDRTSLALTHGWATHAVVVNETLGWAERNVSEKPEKVPEIQSMWMLWKPYFLNRLWNAQGWKPNRFICQRGRWQSFIFMIPDPKQGQPSKF